MRLLRSSAVLAIALVGISCGSDASTAPPGALVGKWGAAGAGIEATASSVTLQLPCSFYHSAGALVPDANGRFVFAATRIGAYRNQTVTVQGTVTGDVLSLRAVITTLDGNASYSAAVTRNAVADFSGIVCAATDG